MVIYICFFKGATDDILPKMGQWPFLTVDLHICISTVKSLNMRCKYSVLPSPVQCPRCWTCDCVSPTQGRWRLCWSSPAACWSSLRPRWAGGPKARPCSTTTTSARRTGCGSIAPSSLCVRRNWQLLQLEWRWNTGLMETGRCWSSTPTDPTHIWWSSEPQEKTRC